MIKAVLFDLDNTLVINPDKMFALTFIQLFDQHFDALITRKDRTASRLWHQTFEVLQTFHPETCNQDVFVGQIAETIGLESDRIRMILDEFYAKPYEQLQMCVQAQDGALALLGDLAEYDVDIVIATNPLHPVSTALRRLHWGNLPDDARNYRFITGSDNMHTLKPSATYYAEIIARIGIEPDEALMVGDRFSHDIQPAQEIGIRTYHLTDMGDTHHSGTLSHLRHLIREGLLDETYPVQHHSRSAVVTQYYGNLNALYGFLKDVKPHYWHQRPDPNEWSIVQILCHLLSSETDNERARLMRIIREDRPFIVAPRPPGPDIPICHDDGMHIAHEFTRARLETIHFVENLSSDDWQRRARHSIFGHTSLAEMAYFTAQHDRLHLMQICQTLGMCAN